MRLGPRLAVGRTAEVFAWTDASVIKLIRPGFSDELVEDEARAAGRVTALGLAAPRFIGLERVGGRIGLVYERVEGPSMLDRLLARPYRLGALPAALAELHATMHGRSGAGLPDALDALRAAIDRSGLSAPIRAAARDRLIRLARLGDGGALVHGDYHPGNVLMSERGPVVIDWMTASSGAPAADVVRTLFLLRDSRGDIGMSWPRRVLVELMRRRFASAYLRRYRRLRPLTDDELRAWRLPILVARAAEGVPGEEAILRRLIARAS